MQINYPSGTNDCKNFEFNNPEIAFNDLPVEHNQEDSKQAFISKHKSKRENGVNGKWHYLTVTKQSALFRGI